MPIMRGDVFPVRMEENDEGHVSSKKTDKNRIIKLQKSSPSFLLLFFSWTPLVFCLQIVYLQILYLEFIFSRLFLVLPYRSLWCFGSVEVELKLA